MKKILLSACVLLASTATFAQSKINNSQNERSIKRVISTYATAPSIVPSNSTAAPAAIWSDDFSVPTNWVIDHDATASSLDWQIGLNSCQGSYQLNDIVSTSAANGWAMIDSDFYGGATGGTEVEDCWLTTADPIDLTGYSDLVINFEANYRSFNNELPYIVVGIGDGSGNVTWPDLTPTTNISAMNNVFIPFDGYASGDETTNPELMIVNISSALVGLTPVQSADIYIRFHWTGTWGYAWFIDDVSISVTPDNRIRMKDEVIGGYWQDFANYSGGPVNSIIGLDYSITPLSQIQNHPFAIEAIVKNEGIATQHVVLNYEVTGAATASGSSSTVILTGSQDSALTTPVFSPATLGDYSIDIWAQADSVGYGTKFTYSDTVTRTTEVSNFIYGKDLGSSNPNSYSLGGPNDQNHITTRYEMYANEQLYSIRTYITGRSAVGALVKAIIYEVDTTALNDVSVLIESDNYTLTAQDTGTWINIPFTNPISLFNGYAYEVGVVGFQSAQDSSFIGVSGGSMYNGEHSSFDEYGLSAQSAGDPSWYYISSCPMIRMNFDPASAVIAPAGLEDLKSNISIYPNPSNGIFVIALDAAVQYNVNVYNVLGQTVYTTSTNSISTQIDLSNFDKGIYTIELETEGAIYTEKIMVE